MRLLARVLDRIREAVRRPRVGDALVFQSRRWTITRIAGRTYTAQSVVWGPKRRPSMDGNLTDLQWREPARAWAVAGCEGNLREAT